MAMIKELNDWISKEIKELTSKDDKYFYSSIIGTLGNVKIELKKLAKKDLRKIEPLLKKGGNWNIVIARAYKEDLEEVVGNVIPKRNAIEVSFKLLKDGRWEEEKR